MKKYILSLFILILFCSGCTTQNKNKIITGELVKSFGSYFVSEKWSEYPELSNENKYFYIKNGTDLNNPTSNISVEIGKNKYAETEHLIFREAILSQLQMQVSHTPNNYNLSGEGTYTKNGYILYIFTIEGENSITTKQYYIVGDYQYVLVIETDFHDENIQDINEVSRNIIDSFKWTE